MWDSCSYGVNQPRLHQNQNQSKLYELGKDLLPFIQSNFSLYDDENPKPKAACSSLSVEGLEDRCDLLLISNI